MRRLKQVFLAAIFFVCFAFPLPADAQDAVNYLGEICFSMSPLGAPEGFFPSGQIGILSFGSGHFALYGTITDLETQPGAAPLVVQGTAIVTGNTVTITLTGSTANTNPTTPAGVVQNIYMTIDASSFAGRYVDMIANYLPPVQGGAVSAVSAFFNGVVQFSQCP